MQGKENGPSFTSKKSAAEVISSSNHFDSEKNIFKKPRGGQVIQKFNELVYNSVKSHMVSSYAVHGRKRAGFYRKKKN